MAALLLALVGVIVANAALAVYLAGRGRRLDRNRDEEIARETAKKALERGIVRVRGERWTREHLER